MMLLLCIHTHMWCYGDSDKINLIIECKGMEKEFFISIQVFLLSLAAAAAQVRKGYAWIIYDVCKWHNEQEKNQFFQLFHDTCLKIFNFFYLIHLLNIKNYLYYFCWVFLCVCVEIYPIKHTLFIHTRAISRSKFLSLRRLHKNFISFSSTSRLNF